MSNVDLVQALDSVMKERFATRFYADRPVSHDTVRDILEAARHAPSGANIQPWQVHALAGAAKAEICRDILATHAAEAAQHVSEYTYYASSLPDRYQGRKQAFGQVFYGSLGIAQDDARGRAAQTARNYDFFGAPVGLIVTIDRRLEKGSWLDLGMFLQNVMLAAKVRGLDTCPQETLAKYHRVLRRHLPIAAEDVVVCGMALGVRDAAAAATRGVMERAPVEAFARFHGFETPSGA
ncbi:Chloronitrobenzene nitroreductase [Methylobacterium crusticola]|uniref:Chloronitrobenzene nitroreductase n=1 Tax=Methylobacterium crusticola TaxID=1697972 RepID=A0ABQ4R738_9HYPH|nr:nitroreductase [Methylobacterium crusticola]GJD53054.1 Chloronitrobenzene nitroreductase [Methylobacterium crusticola]